MGKTTTSISQKHQEFIEKQPLFFVATAPRDESARINLSPKGLDCFRVLGANRVAYLDMTGSGNETAAHISENGRLTVMFCAFDGAPLILRLYGKGRIIFPDSELWNERIDLFNPLPGARQIIEADIDRVQESCGFGVPLMDYVGGRDNLTKWARKMGPGKLATYRSEKNSQSIDGLSIPLAHG